MVSREHRSFLSFKLSAIIQILMIILIIIIMKIMQIVLIITSTSKRFGEEECASSSIFGDSA